MAKLWMTFMLALCVSASGCMYNSYSYAARPVSATMEIEVINPDGTRQWKKVRRMVYEYEQAPPRE